MSPVHAAARTAVRLAHWVPVCRLHGCASAKVCSVETTRGAGPLPIVSHVEPSLSRRSAWALGVPSRRAEPLNACGVGDEEREQRSNQRHDHQVCAGQLLSHPHAATRRAHSTVIDTHAQGHNPITVQWVVVVAIAHGTYSYSGRHRCGERSSAMPCAILDTSREG